MHRITFIALILCLQTWCAMSDELHSKFPEHKKLDALQIKFKDSLKAVDDVKKLHRFNLDNGVSNNYVVRNLKKQNGNDPQVYFNNITLVHLHCPSDTTCWGIGSNYRIYKSSDSMMHWNLVSGIPDNVAAYESVVTRADPNKIYFPANGNQAIITQDGINFRVINNQPFYLTHIRPHPFNSTYLLGASWTGSAFGLQFSQDQGVTWTQLLSTAYDFAWCNPGNGGSLSYKICAITDSNTNGANGGSQSSFVTFDAYSPQAPLSNLDAKADYMIEHPKYLFVVADSMTGSYKNIYISTDNGTTLNEAQFGKGVFMPFFDAANLLDDRQQIILGVVPGVDPTQEGFTAGNIYVGDGTGFRFTLSLGGVSVLSNWWDFGTVYSLEGTYIANVILNLLPDGSVPAHRYAQFQSRITFDNGDHWNTLNAPTTDVNGRPIVCNGCTLNLFGRTTWLGIGGNGYYGDFWSSKTSVGMIMGTGNVGPYLGFSSDEVNTFMSEDGGVYWRTIANTSTVYEFGDHGGILVMVPNQVLTQNLYYSVDSGYTWTSFQFTSSPVTVVNIFTSSSTRSVFAVFAVLNDETVYFGIDFSNIQDTTCTANDYETWSLANEAGQYCLLGHTITYNRKKASSECDNPNDYNPIQNIKNCFCSPEDYECDLGFEQSATSGKCLSDGTTPTVSSCFPNGTQWLYAGYRKTPGDTCVNDLANYTRVSQACTYSGSSSTSGSPVYGGGGSGLSGGLVALIVILVLVFVGMAVFSGIMIGRKTQFCKDRFPFFTGTKFSDVGYSNQLQMQDDDEA